MDRPNILVVQADQHRWDCIGAYGNGEIKTPHIDGIAADGVVYENSFCPYPVCTPSRYSFVSGLYVHQHMGWTNRCTLPPGLATWPKILRAAGYRTAAVGKMHFTPTYLDVGFDEMVLAEQNGKGRYDDDYHRWLREEGTVDSTDLIDQEREYRKDAPDGYWETVGAARSNLDEAHHSTTWIGDRAVERLERWTDGGNVLMASFIKPHHPFDPPAPWDAMYDPDALTIQPGWMDASDAQDVAYSSGYFPHTELTEEKVRLATAMYYATISQIDHHVGRMVEALKANGQYENTLIVYNSDHGEYLGYRHLLLKGNRMYEPLVRVPLIVKWPGNMRSGERCDDLVNTVDLAPTLVAAAGCDAPGEWPGSDLGQGLSREMIFAEVRRGHEYMARSKTQKLLLCADEEMSLFFDLSVDPLERRNVIQDPEYAEDVQAHKEALFRWLAHETPTPTHVFEGAGTVKGGGETDEQSWRENYDYFAGKMRGVLGSQAAANRR